MDRLQRLLGQAGGGGGASGPGGDVPQVDTAEQIYISSLALLKMLKHGARERESMRKKKRPSIDRWGRGEVLSSSFRSFSHLSLSLS